MTFLDLRIATPGSLRCQLMTIVSVISFFIQSNWMTRIWRSWKSRILPSWKSRVLYTLLDISTKNLAIRRNIIILLFIYTRISMILTLWQACISRSSFVNKDDYKERSISRMNWERNATDTTAKEIVSDKVLSYWWRYPNAKIYYDLKIDDENFKFCRDFDIQNIHLDLAVTTFAQVKWRVLDPSRTFADTHSFEWVSEDHRWLRDYHDHLELSSSDPVATVPWFKDILTHSVAGSVVSADATAASLRSIVQRFVHDAETRRLAEQARAQRRERREAKFMRRCQEWAWMVDVVHS